MSDKSYYKNRYEKRKAAGLCPCCGKERDDKRFIMCSKCRSARWKSVESRKEEYEFCKRRRDVRRNSGLCIKCGKQDAYTMNGRSLCYECAEKARLFAQKKRELTNGQKNAEYQKNLRKKRVESGICEYCGKKIAKFGYKVCMECRTKMRKKKLERERNNGVCERQKYVRCWQCNKNPPMEGRTLCQSCYDKKLILINRINAERNKRYEYEKLTGQRRVYNGQQG